MENKSLLEIIELNKEFYSKHNESFDKSRSYGFWEGFEETIDVIPQNSKILDLGCGNARFLKFLLEKNIPISEYQGIDNSDEFILKNQDKYQNYKFEVMDVVLEINKIKDKFSVIVAFGITHHIPDREYRKKWFKQIEELASENGYIIISFWNFDKNKNDKTFKTKIYTPQEGDYFLGWKEDYSSHRYCHFYEVSEIQDIVKEMRKCTLVKKFEKDQNTYLILQKHN